MIKLYSFSLFVALLTERTLSLLDDSDKNGKAVVLDTERDARVFKIGMPASGHTYLESMKIESITSMEIMGTHMDTVTNMRTETETSIVTDPINTELTQVETMIKRMEFHMETVGVSFECDTSEDKDSANDMCISMYDIINVPSNFTLNEEGEIVDASGIGADVVTKIQKLTSGKDKETDPKPLGMDRLNPTQHWEQKSRVLELLPSDSIAVKPGETWDSSVDFGDIGTFKGTGKLLGYRKIDGRDCAVISSIGVLHVDYQKVVGTMFGDNDAFKELMKDITVDDASMDTLVYYDYEYNFVRWSKTSQSMTMEMPNMLDSTTKTKIPIDETVVISSRIKE